jgi:4-hydroxythreonine-4-phosphate dehydrogenase
MIFADPDMLLDRAKTLNLTLKISESESTSSTQTLCIYPIKTADKVIARLLAS